jgi:hypothetical protein
MSQQRPSATPVTRRRPYGRGRRLLTLLRQREIVQRVTLLVARLECLRRPPIFRRRRSAIPVTKTTRRSNLPS